VSVDWLQETLEAIEDYVSILDKRVKLMYFLQQLDASVWNMYLTFQRFISIIKDCYYKWLIYTCVDVAEHILHRNWPTGEQWAERSGYQSSK
jgi:hypothetical protein